MVNGSPDYQLLPPGKTAVWVSGDLGIKGRLDGDKGAAGELGFKTVIADALQGEIALGRQYARNDTLYDGKNTLRSAYVAPGISYRIPDTQYQGSPNVKTMAARLRAGWLDAFALGPVSGTPYTSLTGSKYKLDSYRETGGGFPAKWDEQKDTAKIACFEVDNTW